MAFSHPYFLALIAFGEVEAEKRLNRVVIRVFLTSTYTDALVVPPCQAL